MIETEARAMICDTLRSIAPETEPESLADDADMREALDLDSMDFMNYVVGLHERTGIDIPEADYPKLRTLAGAIAYLNR